MSRIDLYINGKNARTEWGVLITQNTIGQLLMPAKTKERIKNSSPLEHGARYDLTAPKTDVRDLNLEIQMIADNETQFYARHEAFVAELVKDGYLKVYTSNRPNVVYRLLYNSCTQYTEFNHGIATFSLKVTEPNPRNRGIND